MSFILLLVLMHLTYKLKLITMKVWKLSIGLIFDQLHFVYSNSSNFEWRVLRQQIFVLTKHKAQDHISTIVFTNYIVTSIWK